MRDRADLRHEGILLHGARGLTEECSAINVTMEINDGRLVRLQHSKDAELQDQNPTSSRTDTVIDLSGLLIMPGLINAHDHLQFALFPRLGHPPYPNYVAWGEDIHATLAETIAQHKAVPKNVRLWWGSLHALLCGVTTVCHHDPLWPELEANDFPVRVVQQYGWAHSVLLGGNLRKARSATPNGRPFFVHACEGVDDLAREEIVALDRLGVLDASTVLIHGLALDSDGAALLQSRGSSLILCPSSNHFLFEQLPNIDLLDGKTSLALGNDSPLTAAGDQLDERLFVILHWGLEPERAFRMVTTDAASILRLPEAGALLVGGVADLIAVQDTDEETAHRMRTLSMVDVELVIVGGSVQLASEFIWRQLPETMRGGMEPLWIDGVLRWLRAPVTALLGEAEAVLGSNQVRLGGRPIKRYEPDGMRI